MMKYAIAVSAAVLACVPQAASQSILQKSDWKDTGFERFLPPADAAVPWLQLDNKTKLPKGDLPVGRQASSVGPFIIAPGVTERRVGERAFRLTENVAMSDRTWIKLDEFRQPGMRRVLKAMKLLEEEAPGLTREAALASVLHPTNDPVDVELR